MSRLKSFNSNYPNLAPFTYAIIGVVCTAFCSLLVKLCKDIKSIQILYFRSIITIPINNYLINREKGFSVYPEDLSLNAKLIMRGLMSQFYVVCLYSAYQMIDLGTATILNQTSPIWTYLIGLLFFHEIFSGRLMLYIVLGFAGIVLVVQPSFLFAREERPPSQSADAPSSLVYLEGQVLSILSAVFFAFMGHISRSLKGKTTSNVIVQYLNIIQAMACPVFLISMQYFNERIYTPHNLLFMAGISFLTFTAQVLINQAFFLKPASQVSPIISCQVVFAYLFDFCLFDKELDLLSIFGAAVVVATSLLIVQVKK